MLLGKTVKMAQLLKIKAQDANFKDANSTKSFSSKEMTSPTVKSPELHLSDDEQIFAGCMEIQVRL